MQVSKKLRQVGLKEGYTAGGYSHYCPACKEMHAFATEAPQWNGARWSFDGNLECPTFNPSMNIRIGPYPKDGHIEICHYFLKAGQIQYLCDCTHDMANQTVELPDLPLHLWDRDMLPATKIGYDP